jgi:trigger factor
MKYTKELLADKKLKFKIELSSEEWDKQVDKAYESTKSKYRVQGFRNGKAPRRVIENAYGKEVFYDEALNNCFYEYYNEVLTKEKVEPVGNPHLDVEKLDDSGVTLVITTAIYPEVKLGDYKGLTIEKEEIKVTAAEVNGAIKDMQEKSARMVVVNREAKNGDTVIIDFVGKKDGKAFDGGAGKGYELVLGSGTFIPGFEEQLVGIKGGESRVLDVTFPKDYPAEELANAPCTFDVDCKEVREKVLPELNDEFAKNVSEYDTLDEYKKSVKADIKKQKEQKAEQDAQTKLLEKICDNATVEIPEEMVAEQVDEFINQFDKRLKSQGLDLDGYVKYMNTTIDALKKSREDDARKTVKTRLVLEEIIKAENIKLEKEDVDAEIEKQAKFSGLSAEEFKKSVDEELLNQIANNLVINKLLTFLKSNNNM